MRRLRSLALPTLSGVLYFVSWVGFGVWPLAFVCFVPLLLSLREATPREALRRGAWFGFVAHLGGDTWALRRTWTANRWPLAGLLALCLVATEFVYPLLFQSYTGVALMPVLPLVQVADLGGVLLLSALQASVNGALADLFLTRRAWPVIGTALAVAATLTYGLWRMARIDAREQAAPMRRIGIAQSYV